MYIDGKKVLVFGAARTGIESCKFLELRGCEVILTDIKKGEELGDIEKEISFHKGIKTIFGRQPDIESIRPDYIIVSPGISLDINPLKKAKKLKIPIYSELELSYIYSDTDWISVTGTNGKTTTTSLLADILANEGKNYILGGNIGYPIISRVLSKNMDYILAETSSFQLEATDKFRPRVSVILNITPDHLDRHKNFSEYARCKSKSFINQKDSDFLILNYDDLYLRKMSQEARAKVLFFSSKEEIAGGVYYKDKKIYSSLDGKEKELLNVEDLELRGSHNYENIMATILVAYCLELSESKTLETITNFKSIEHRLEYAGEKSGVLYINDSKGTNPEASIKALDSYERPIVLIAGGKNKGSKFDLFAEKIKESVKEVVLVGESKFEIQKALEKVGFSNIYLADDFEEAVLKANSLAKEGDLVLLSPACASWDMFASFEERGEVFKKIVSQI